MTEEELLQVWVVEKRDKRRLHGEIDMRVVKLTPETVNYLEGRVEGTTMSFLAKCKGHEVTGTTNRPGWIGEQINTDRRLRFGVS